MKEKQREYVRHSRRDYNVPFKLAVVSEIEQGEIFISGKTSRMFRQGRCIFRYDD